MSHTSGLQNYYNDPTFNFRLDYSDDELLAIMKSLPLDFQPGTQGKYSNSGYTLLGIIIKKVTGEHFGVLLHQYIFAPFEMSTAGIINESDIILNRASGYQLVNDKLKNQDYVSPTLNSLADGALYLSVLDMAKWAAVLDTDKLLSQSDLQTMWTPTILSNGEKNKIDNAGYSGFGWFINNMNGHHVIEHGGLWQGFRTHITRYPNDNLTVIVLTNFAESHPELIAHGIADMYVAECAEALMR